jgi:hypothetical protein
MSDKQWVQHVSGQGEKFRVDDSNPFCWEIFVSDMVQNCWVPKSEYRLCDRPDRWVDVTNDCLVNWSVTRAGTDTAVKVFSFTFPNADIGTGIRLRKVRAYIDEFNQDLGCKVESYAFIVERKEQP